MATGTLEERVRTLEQELAHLKQQVNGETPQSPLPWWEQNFGSFANSEHYEEAMRLGREYRESLRPKEDEETDGCI